VYGILLVFNQSKMFSPSGKKFRSKPQLARHIGDGLDLATFDFRTGKVNAMLSRKSSKKHKSGAPYDFR